MALQKKAGSSYHKNIKKTVKKNMSNWQKETCSKQNLDKISTDYKQNRNKPRKWSLSFTLGMTALRCENKFK